MYKWIQNLYNFNKLKKLNNQTVYFVISFQIKLLLLLQTEIYKNK